ncbi:MAG TPA: glycerate dehydrogenase, partial [Ruminococcus sp.]|nr:glycerate dehydrogenase [Ruminococcus sp.]
MKIVVLDWNTIAADGDISCSELEKLGDVRIFPMTPPEQTVQNISDAEIVLCNKVLITRDVMDKCPNIKYIGLFATGFNNVDIEYAAQKNIT